MQELIDAYLSSKSTSWSDTTLKSEAARLRLIKQADLQDAAGLYKRLVKQGYKPYSIKTIFIRAGGLVEFGVASGYLPPQINSFQQFLHENARLFRHAYVPKKPSCTFEEARAKINTLEPAMQQQALALLASGLRISEAVTVRTDGTVLGKGGRRRQVINAPSCSFQIDKLRKALTSIGLTPHMLRKLAATKAVELGAREADLLAIFGWSSAQTASYYVQATNVDKVSAALKGLVDAK